ncbi:DUF2793 domain-containing protein [Tropicimonas sp.]|uniref:DUF2793 domain-containing protein n=1 Tax=Tropicimonas sp. TaxID=2067044 RepID=UPI003A859D54
MSETANLGLPLLQPSQAQKHVTVNEALVRLDSLTQLTLLSRSVSAPAEVGVDGSCYAVPTGATGDWSGRDGSIAVYSNGGWIFAIPGTGWKAWISDENCTATFHDGAWHCDVTAIARNGAASLFGIDELDYRITLPGTQEIPLDIPQDAMVFACSARVFEDITGSLGTWSLGLSDEPAKFGSGMGLATGSYCTGILSQPTTYYTNRRPLLSPIGGEFYGGRLKLALHTYRIALPI